MVIAMVTSVQVSDQTHNMLKMMKTKSHADSYDDVILMLIRTTEHIPDSMFGSNKKLSRFTEKERAEFHDV